MSNANAEDAVCDPLDPNRASCDVTRFFAKPWNGLSAPRNLLTRQIRVPQSWEQRTPQEARLVERDRVAEVLGDLARMQLTMSAAPSRVVSRRPTVLEPCASAMAILPAATLALLEGRSGDALSLLREAAIYIGGSRKTVKSEKAV